MPKYRDVTTRIWTEKRTKQDDPKIRGEADYREPDKVILESNGNYVVEPRDRSVGLPGSGREPEWGMGWYIQDRASGQPVWVGEGEPPDQLKQAWRDGQPLVGILAIRDEAEHN